MAGLGLWAPGAPRRCWLLSQSIPSLQAFMESGRPGPPGLPGEDAWGLGEGGAVASCRDAGAPGNPPLLGRQELLAPHAHHSRSVTAPCWASRLLLAQPARQPVDSSELDAASTGHPLFRSGSRPCLLCQLAHTHGSDTVPGGSLRGGTTERFCLARALALRFPKFL